MARRRGHNEGTIRERADGRWEARVTVGWKRGKLQRKSIYGKTRDEVQKKLVAALSDQHEGIPIDSERQTFGQFLNNWIEHQVKPNRRASTLRSYRQNVRNHIIPSLGRHQLTKLSPQHIQALINEKLKEGLSPRSVQYYHATVRAALNQALRWGLVKRNVANLVDPPRVQRHKITPLAPEEAMRLLKTAEGHRLSALFTVALAIGLRQGEALGLQWEDVDLESGAVTIRHQLQRVDGRLQLVEPKSDQSRRSIALPEITLASLRRHRIHQLEERMAAGTYWSDTGFVFTTRNGTPLEGSNVRRVFLRLLKQAELPEVRFHDLRHTCASLLLAQNVHPRIVMETLGHSQISLTMNTYSHVAPDLQRQAAERIDHLFKGIS